MNCVMTLGAVLAVFWFDAAVAQEGYFGHDHDKWHHGFYQTLERPDTKSPCCNLTDCRPTSGRQVDGHYEVKVNGAWVSVPAGKILKQSAPTLDFTSVLLSNSMGNPITSTASLSRQKSRVRCRARRPLVSPPPARVLQAATQPRRRVA
jgi:hypothetical protein